MRIQIALAVGGLLVAAASSAGEAEDKQLENSMSSLTNTNEAAGADGDSPRRQLVGWNEYKGPFVTARLGGGFLWDYSGYDQDEDSKGQMSLENKGDLRDFRVLLKGAFPKLPGLSYTVGYMYDKAADAWKFRQTGLQYAIPSLYGNVFIGRTKEGISTNKLMVGYQGWTMERATINDALFPILADGVKWMGNSPKGQFVYSLGWFGDHFSEKQSFNRSDSQVVGRLVWLPFLLSDPERVLHLAIAYRHANADDGFLQLRSKPESYQAQSYAIDTGKFAAQGSDIVGLEAYYRPGSWTFGMEYYLDQISSHETDDPFFHGGEVFASYILTGERKPYNTASATFERVSPKNSVFEGGRGAWEAVLRYSYSDLDSKSINGGKFWRITPVLNWHMSDNVRLEFVYGYGILDRFDTKGATQFFQSRIQLQL
jgi:phosphate-selective porin OprO/OprP